MLSIQDLYSVLTAVVPLYITMFLAYASVKWWNIFSPDQCSGINRFVAIFAVPLLSFEFISHINPYKMDLRFIAADVLSKILILIALFLWAKFARKGSLDWAITLFSVSTLPNTLVLGIPLLKSMYGDDKEPIMIQAVVLQCIIWYTLLLFLFEYRAAKVLVNKSKDCCSAATAESQGNEEESLKGIQEKSDGNSSNKDDTINVILTAPKAQMDKVEAGTQQHKPMISSSATKEKKEVHFFVWPCGCLHSRGIQKQSYGSEEQLEDIEKSMNLEKPDRDSSASRGLFKKIMKMVCIKLVRNPNSYASVLGLTWALVSFRWGIKKPQILDNSVTILSNAGLGMAMFSLGLFMALQPKIIACGKKLAVYGMIARFIAGPAVMALASIGVGLKGTILKVSIVQAALPQGIVPFVFAREYNLHPSMLSTAVIFGMIVSLPITMLYYILLGL